MKNKIKIMLGTIWIVNGLVHLFSSILGGESSGLSLVFLSVNLILAGGIYIMGW